MTEKIKNIVIPHSWFKIQLEFQSGSGRNWNTQCFHQTFLVIFFLNLFLTPMCLCPTSTDDIFYLIVLIGLITDGFLWIKLYLHRFFCFLKKNWPEFNHRIFFEKKPSNFKRSEARFSSPSDRSKKLRGEKSFIVKKVANSFPY